MKKFLSIPLHPNTQSRGINPPTPRVLVQGDQSPTIQVSYPGGTTTPYFFMIDEDFPKSNSIPHHPESQSRGINPPLSSQLVQRDKKRKMINPPPTRLLVQGDQSPTYQVSSPGGSIPHLLDLQSRGINPPPTVGLVQGDQSPTKKCSNPLGSIPRSPEGVNE